MTAQSALPTAQSEKVALLKAAAACGDHLRPLLAIGTPANRLRDFASSESALTVTEVPSGLKISFGDYIYWDVTVDDEDIVRGHLSSGYGDLMEALQIDFAGRPYAPGNGN